ncbi:carbon-nitrogen hydrolase family protein [Pseudomonas paeninsulae]|uniref:carbon-nitrogen hydrolase family protein n=1 Tax=Pseudomonas paeninsulae TaxID=3110772 RepID=UPI002D77FBF3|nr:carbon-nitrogen hydrolase family protein [Pseudomonas sp. IT1137]
MPSMRIAAAQSLSVPGDLAANVAIHCSFIAAASAAGVDLLVFPELSLSGYELPLLGSRTVQPEDEVLAPIRQLVRARAMTVVLGAALPSTTARPYIGAITFFPDGRTSRYCKQYLDPSEAPFATQGERGAKRHNLAGESFTLAICADTTHAQHAQNAAATGASLYLAGVLVSQKGYPLDSANLSRYAASYAMTTLMANHGGTSGRYLAAGRSAIWAPGGKLVVEAPGPGSYLVIAAKESARWTGELRSLAT